MIALADRLRDRPSKLVGSVLWVVPTAVAVLAVVVAVADERSSLSHDAWVLGQAALACAIAAAAAWTVSNTVLSPVGWMSCGLALGFATWTFSREYVAYSVTPGSPPGRPAEAAAVAGHLAFMAIVLAAPFVSLLTARARRRSRVLLPLAAAAVVSLVLFALVPGSLPQFPSVDNPLGVSAIGDLGVFAEWAWLPVASVALLLALTGLARRAGDEPVEQEIPPLREPRKRTWSFLRDFPRVLPYLRPYWKLWSSSVGVLFLGLIAGLLAPWPLAILVDTVLREEQPLPSLLGFLGEWDRMTLLMVAVTAGVVVTALEHGVGVGESYVNTALQERMALDVRSDLFRHAQRLSQAYHEGTTKGALMFTLTHQADAVGAVTVSIGPLVQSLLMLIGMFAIAFLIDPWLALLSLTVVPFIYYSTGYYTRRIEPRLYHVRGLEGQSMSIVFEAMAMLRVVVAFGREKYEYGRFRRQGEEAVDARLHLTVRQTLFSLAINVLTAAGTALVLGFGGWHVIQQDLTVGELLVIVGYIAAVYAPLQEVISTVAILQEQFINMRMALDLLDTPPDIQEDPDAITIERVRGDLVVDEVSFNYLEREGTLRHISFAVQAGQRIGIAGRTGAGKSTLISLLPRFYDPAEGSIRLDGIETRRLTLESLRRQFSVVHQEPMLFSGTIADNIRYGRLEASEEEIVRSAEAANAHDFISALPDGYETKLGEGGAQLSGGERQRIAVARAFLKDAPILILDEPTSSIDSNTEAVILEALERLMVGRTTITIAHRLATIRRADLILVMDHGEIVERGTHAELLGANGLYRTLYEAQLAEEGRDAETNDAVHERFVATVARALEAEPGELRSRAEDARRALRESDAADGGKRLRDASAGDERP
jgi:ATP-binding cassette, subfamily B, bacterial